MRTLLEHALNAAMMAGADYVDARVTESLTERVSVRTGRVDAVESGASLGIGVRVLADGAWGFAATSAMDDDAVTATTRQAVALAKAAALAPGKPVHLAPAEAVQGRWASPCETDPFAVPLEDKIALLLEADAGLRTQAAIKVTEGRLDFLRCRKWFASSEGSFVEQLWTESGGGLCAYAVGDGEILPRSYPNSMGGQWVQGGWESVLAMDLTGNAPRVAEEAAALMTARTCPSEVTTVILASNQLALQVHESVGHPTELDRVLGDETAFAGTSWVGLGDLGTLAYGSGHVTVTADATLPGALGSFGWDDEGVPGQRDFLVRDGVLAGFLSSRESAPEIGRASNGCMRADGWSRTPLVRMTTVSLEPGDWSLEDLIADTDEGIYLETNNSWSIDDKRLNFQFGCEVGRIIENGQLGALVKNPNYTGITPEFWASCDAVCSRDHWTVWGLPNCGKGEPMQVAHVAHGAAPARFRDVRVGVGR